MKPITLVNLGPGDEGSMTLSACDALLKADAIVLRTIRHGASEWLKRKQIAFETLDALYEGSESFDELYEQAAKQILSLAQIKSVVYAAADMQGDGIVPILRHAAGEHLQQLPGVPLHAPMISAAGVQEGCIHICPASQLEITNSEGNLYITEIDSALLASECKLKLLPWYGENAQIIFFPPASGSQRTSLPLPLSELDRQPYYDHTAGALILHGGLYKDRYDLNDLLELMRYLRSEKGCPWDRKQTHESLRPFLIEEAYETALAIDEKDEVHIADELGDVLLQIALHAVIGEQYGTMDITDITTAICKKMIFRHRHVFGDEKCENPDEVVELWKRVKSEERDNDRPVNRMTEIKNGLPPLLRAEKVQKKARDVGFDWNTPEEALDKVLEEAQEVRDELKNKEHLEEEIGDLFFSCVNTARLCGVDADRALSIATEKFIDRFTWMENQAQTSGKALETLTIQEMSVYWESSKTLK